MMFAIDHGIAMAARSLMLMSFTVGLALVTTRRAGRASFRHGIWAASVMSLLPLAPLNLLLPQLVLPLPGLSARTIAMAAQGGSAAAPVAAGNAVLLIYAVGVAALLARLALSRFLLFRIWKQAEPAASIAEAVRAVQDMRRDLNIGRRVALRFSDSQPMPMTWGALRPKILLPSSAQRWSHERIRLVIAHELGHVARFDSLTQSIAALAVAIHWYNPLAHYALRRMRREQELACDQRVLGGGADAADYARTLLEIASTIGGGRLVRAGSLGMARPAELERRIMAILAGRAPARQRAIGAMAAIFAIVGSMPIAATILPVAMNGPSPIGGVIPAPRSREALGAAAGAAETAGARDSGQRHEAALRRPSHVVPQTTGPSEPPEADGPDAPAVPAPPDDPTPPSPEAAQDRIAPRAAPSPAASEAPVMPAS